MGNIGFPLYFGSEDFLMIDVAECNMAMASENLMEELLIVTASVAFHCLVLFYITHCQEISCQLHLNVVPTLLSLKMV